MIVALGLMAFILLMILSLAALVGLESASVQQTRMLKQARQNALLGMQIAIGEVQQSLGPDNRISAVATIKDTNPYDTDDLNTDSGALLTDGLSGKRQLWTGVWDSERDADGKTSVAFRKWLVSGFSDTHTFTESDVASGATAFSDPVDLISDTTTVEAGKVSLYTDGQLSGKYAYWVGDEGVKAKANLASPETDDGQSAGRFGIEAMTDISWLAGNPDMAENTLGFSSFQTFAERQGGTIASDKSESRFHDLTFYSAGVLSNSVDGGLRNDLTKALYDSSTQPDGLMFEPVGGTVTALDPGGPYWDQLRSWVALQADAATGELPVQAATTTKAGLYPVLAGAQIYIIPTYTVEGAEAQIYYNLFPAVILWNPYNEPIESEDYIVSMARTETKSNPNSFTNMWKFWQYILYRLEVKVSGVKLPPFLLQGYQNRADFYLTSGRLEPGEAIVYSPEEGFVDYDIANPSPAISRLERGFRPGFGGFRFETPFRVALPPDFSGDIQFFFRDVNISRIHSMQLLLGTDYNSSEVLQRAVYMNDTPFSNYTVGLVDMEETSDDLDLEYTIGLKSIMLFSENDEFWPVDAEVPPESWKWVGAHNPRARLFGPNPFIFEDFVRDTVSQNPSYATNFSRSGSSYTIGFSDNASNQVENGIVGNYQTVLFEAAPEREQLRSIGQLSQAPLFNNGGSFEATVRYSRFDNLIPTYVIGNGRADPSIELDELYRDWDGAYTTSQPENFTFKGMHYDYVYKMNEALWDDWFFSTLPANATLPDPANSRLLPYQSASQTLNATTSAANLLLDGAFNINSTSVEAWKAMLASFYASDIERQDGSMDAHDSENPQSPYLRHDTPFGGPVTETTHWTDEVNYQGYRRLSAAQIQELAQHIVEEIKLRGPFGSLAEFVNRMPYRDGTFSESENAFRLKGALTAAIDKSSVNDHLKASLLESQHNVSKLNEEAHAGWRTEDLPGWLSQVDILSRIGGSISARSDTFRIRAYGEGIAPITGEVVAARCEAIIQRVPEYTDASMNAPEDGDADLTDENRIFGRRFELVDFRWLEDDEI